MATGRRGFIAGLIAVLAAPKRFAIAVASRLPVLRRVRQPLYDNASITSGKPVELTFFRGGGEGFPELPKREDLPKDVRDYLDSLDRKSSPFCGRI